MVPTVSGSASISPAELSAHQDALLLDRRCGRCAERTSALAILRGSTCGACDAHLTWNGRGGVLAGLDAQRALPRRLGYVLIAVSSGLLGVLPFAQLFVQAAGLVVLHLVQLRRPLLWLSPRRRLLARMTLKLWGSTLLVASLFGSILLAPLHAVPGLGTLLNAGAHGVAGALCTVLYIEGGLALLRRRLRWEAEGRPLAAAEWGPPLVLLGALLGFASLVVGALAALFYTLRHLPVPGTTRIVEWLLSVGS
jgi:hypothetical protein